MIEQRQKGEEVTTIVLMPHVDGEKLRRLREERFLSHRELANLAGVSPTTVINLETNEEISPQRRTIRKLARALEVDPHELTRRAGDA